MSYVEKALANNETIKLEAKLTWRSFPFSIILSVCLIPYFGLGLIGLFRIWLTIRCYEFAVTDRRIIAKRGIISRKTCEINLKKVESVQIDQGLLGRMLNYGTLIISGTGTVSATIPDIDNPVIVKTRLQEILDASHGASLQQAVPSTISLVNHITPTPAIAS